MGGGATLCLVRYFLAGGFGKIEVGRDDISESPDETKDDSDARSCICWMVPRW
jgi:hypothetical protein